MASDPTYRVRNWSEFQHYGDKRSPPWIKLHRALLNNREWHSLSGDASKLLVECWLVASETPDGSIPLTLADLAWRLRRSECEARAWMNELVAQRFIEVCQQDASAPLASCEQDACLDVDVEEEKKEEKEKKTDIGPAEPDPEAGAFEDYWTRRPRRDGADPKKAARKAWNARRREGHTVEAILAATDRYRRWCEVKGKVGTETVMRASTFLGDAENIANPWVPSAPPPPARQRPEPPQVNGASRRLPLASERGGPRQSAADIAQDVLRLGVG